MGWLHEPASQPAHHANLKLYSDFESVRASTTSGWIAGDTEQHIQGIFLLSASE